MHESSTSYLEIKGCSPENRTQTTSESPLNLETIPESSTMIVDSGASIPRAIVGDQFLEHFHDDTTTVNLKCDEILDHIGPSSAPDPTTLKRPHLQQRVFPSKEQRVLDLLVQQTQPIKYRGLAVSKYASQHS